MKLCGYIYHQGTYTSIKLVLKRVQEFLPLTGVSYLHSSSTKALARKWVGVIDIIIPRTSEFAFQNPLYSNILMGLGPHSHEHRVNLLKAFIEQVTNCT